MNIGDLTPDPKNARKHNERNIGQIVESLQEVGASRSIVIDENNVILAGNGVTEAAAIAGIENVRIIEADGNEIIAVRRSGLTEEQKKRLALWDNRAAELAEWNLDQLYEDRDLLDGLFTKGEIDELLKGLGDEPQEDPGAQIDKAEELREKWQVESGQLWQLGDHRVICGDCTDAAVVERLMGGEKAQMVFTDPPWNVAIGKDSNPRHRQREGLENDSMSSVDFADFIGKAAVVLARHCEGDVYCVLGASEWPTLDSELRKAGFHWSATIIWVKDIFVLGRSKYHRRYEPIWYGWNKDGKSSFNGRRDLDDVWEIDRPRVSEEHPTMKPVELVQRAIENSSNSGDIVFDPFIGGGSTLVASEQLGRVCFSADIAPKYVAVTLERWSTMTGKTPVLVEA